MGRFDEYKKYFCRLIKSPFGPDYSWEIGYKKDLHVRFGLSVPKTVSKEAEEKEARKFCQKHNLNFPEMPKSLNEGLFSSLMQAILAYGAKKQLDRDPEFAKTIKKYDDEIAQLAIELEKDMKKIRKM